MGKRLYGDKLIDVLDAVFEQQSYFSDFFGGGVESIDGVADGDTAFKVKGTDMPVVINEYSTDADVAFGTGTSMSNRFGELQEVIYETIDVPYTWPWSFNEGLDVSTVNMSMDEAVADRLVVQSQTLLGKFNAKHGEFIAANAGEKLEITTVDNDSVIELFNDLSTHFINKHAVGRKIASVAPEVYNVIVDHPLATKEKASSVNIDNNTVLKFKGFEIQEVPESLFTGDNVVYAYVFGVGKAFTGVNITRTIPVHPDFAGTALQGMGKAGEFIPEANKAAVVAVEKVPAG